MTVAWSLACLKGGQKHGQRRVGLCVRVCNGNILSLFYDDKLCYVATAAMAMLTAIAVLVG